MPNHFVTAVAGIVIGVLLVAAVAAIRQAILRRGTRDSLTDLLQKHFGKC